MKIDLRLIYIVICLNLAEVNRYKTLSRANRPYSVTGWRSRMKSLGGQRAEASSALRPFKITQPIIADRIPAPIKPKSQAS